MVTCWRCHGWKQRELLYELRLGGRVSPRRVAAVTSWGAAARIRKVREERRSIELFSWRMKDWCYVLGATYSMRRSEAFRSRVTKSKTTKRQNEDKMHILFITKGSHPHVP
ncbi:hypothetical protein VIGAN_06118100 [Vigna angularis var. angularis]|uniref:Uncharacterized protein n=1 Tax=Vigna angularis var. angularis TaxID=157739 RepID=A0A0S3SB11_PHAAN|nr:hypothetical protein VIGAN_06118100 [Vigna angularis var. angularis]